MNTEAKLLSPSQAADELGVTGSRVHALLTQGRVIGAMKIGKGKGSWCIPSPVKVAPAGKRNRKMTKIDAGA